MRSLVRWLQSGVGAGLIACGMFASTAFGADANQVVLGPPVAGPQGFSLVSENLLEVKVGTTSTTDALMSPVHIDLLEGSVLKLTLVDSVHTFIPGTMFRLFDWNATSQSPGTFRAIQVPEGTAWDFAELYSSGNAIWLGISSDLQRDGDVDLDDLTRLLENWTGAEHVGVAKIWSEGDGDADGDVDSQELLTFITQWTGPRAGDTSGDGDGTTNGEVVPDVPEPSATALGLIGLLTTLAGCRRRL